MNFLKSKISAIKTFCRLLRDIQGEKWSLSNNLLYLTDFIIFYHFYLTSSSHVVAQCTPVIKIAMISILFIKFLWPNYIWSVLIIINTKWNRPKTAKNSVYYCFASIKLNWIRFATFLSWFSCKIGSHLHLWFSSLIYQIRFDDGENGVTILWHELCFEAFTNEFEHLNKEKEKNRHKSQKSWTNQLKIDRRQSFFDSRLFCRWRNLCR